ncbi:hypothetical protein KIPB_008808, partial [Kipferlia bialata]|eukprot:g8808.t1
MYSDGGGSKHTELTSVGDDEPVSPDTCSLGFPYRLGPVLGEGSFATVRLAT